MQEDLQGELQVSHKANLQCTSLNALVMDSVMETELTARPDTNSGLHYMPTYMYRGQLSWIQIRSYTYSLPEKVGNSHCFSNCPRFKTVDVRNYVLTVEEEEDFAQTEVVRCVGAYPLCGTLSR